MPTQKQIRAHLAAGNDRFLRRHRFPATDLVNRTSGAGFPVTESPQTENPEIGFVCNSGSKPRHWLRSANHPAAPAGANHLRRDIL